MTSALDNLRKSLRFNIFSILENEAVLKNFANIVRKMLLQVCIFTWHFSLSKSFFVYCIKYHFYHYSLFYFKDFLQIQSGQLQAMLKKSLKTASKHVYECGLCSQKGFICEICKNPQVIYPFEMDTTHRVSWMYLFKNFAKDSTFLFILTHNSFFLFLH